MGGAREGLQLASAPDRLRPGQPARSRQEDDVKVSSWSSTVERGLTAR